MHKPRDYDAELKALDDKARELKKRKVRQLGELVIACRADALPVEELAGALLSAAAPDDSAAKEEWRTGNRRSRSGGGAGGEHSRRMPRHTAANRPRSTFEGAASYARKRTLIHARGAGAGHVAAENCISE